MNISFKNVYKNYGNNSVIKNLNFDISSGERVVFLGPSGCGKSTILRLIAGLESVCSGQIYFDDVLVNELPSGKRNIAFVFQNYALYPHLNVFDNIVLGLKINKVKKEEIEKRALNAIKILNLEGLEKRYPKELSGGQRQRVALCRAIVKHSKIFLLDEPLSNLDVTLRNISKEELLKLHEIYKPTFIYVTHDQIEAMTLGQKIVVINKGEIQQIGSPENIYLNPINLFVAKFIGLVQINVLKIKYKNKNFFFEDNIIDFKLNNFSFENIAEFYLAIRPEHIQISIEKKEGFIESKIIKVENYTNQMCITILFYQKKEIKILCPYNEELKKLNNIYIKFDEKRLLFFDIKNEKNLFHC